jgi:glycosyltransferase involved in cell wall biosynthesis
MAADNQGLGEATRLFCNSYVVRDRLKTFNQVDAEVLYPPLLAPNQFYKESCGDYLVYCSRLTHQKRQWLAIEALRHTRTPVKLVIAGCPDPGADWYLEQLYLLVERYKLGNRVSIIPRWISEQEKIELFARCLAGVYFPIDEDSYGYPSLEAHAARKAVLTTIDSGGTRELIIGGTNGFVTPADPELIADAMDQLYNNRSMADETGQVGWHRAAELGISCDRVLSKLLA